MSQIELKAEDLYDKDKVDIEEVDIDDVFKLLQCTDAGLSQEEATRRLEIFGPNRLEQNEQNPFLQVSIRLSSSFPSACATRQVVLFLTRRRHDAARCAGWLSPFSLRRR